MMRLLSCFFAVVLLSLSVAVVGDARPIAPDGRLSPDTLLADGQAAVQGVTGSREDAERGVLHELNLLRSNPGAYARQYLVPMRGYYQGRLFRRPGMVPILTQEGVSALDECIRVLERSRPVGELAASPGLARAARDHVRDQSASGRVGHTGADGSGMELRISRYGRWLEAAGENISYGYDDPRSIVTALLVDDGVASRGHRRNLLSDRFRVVGIAIGSHRVYRQMCVMDFAGGYAVNH